MLRQLALQIWHAGLDAVRSDRLVREAVRVEAGCLWFADQPIELDPLRRIVVVGAGKAGAGMVTALEQILGPDLLREKQVGGWVIVPADCLT